MSEEKIIEFFKSPENLSVLKNSKDENEIIEFLSKNGISVSIEKAKALKKLLKSTEKYNRKLSEEELDTFNAYIDDCMDSIAFGNSDWVAVYKKITQGRMSEKSEYRCQRARDDYEQDY